MAASKPALVVGAAILDGRRLLAAQRAGPPHLAGRWELPGGKVEAGETPTAALVRECREELGVDIELGAEVPGNYPLSDGRLMRVWLARVRAGVPAALADHQALRWLEPYEWHDVAWLDADRPVIAALERLLFGPPPVRPPP